MSVQYKCPSCEYKISVPSIVSEMVENETMEEIGCYNTNEHPDNDPLVMWKENE